MKRFCSLAILFASLLVSGYAQSKFFVPLSLLVQRLPEGNEFRVLERFSAVPFDSPGTLLIDGSVANPKSLAVQILPNTVTGMRHFYASGPLRLKLDFTNEFDISDEYWSGKMYASIYKGWIGNTRVEVDICYYTRGIVADPFDMKGYYEGPVYVYYIFFPEIYGDLGFRFDIASYERPKGLY